jgi:Fur family ferric uptake transcriptional regulator
MTEKAHHHVHDSHSTDKSALLRKAGLKVTKARLAILDLLAREHGPFTIDEMREHLSRRKSFGRCDLVTIYRCISKFESLGMISRCDFGDGVLRYELVHGDHHHHHIICRSCKKIEALPRCPVEDKAFKVPKTGFRDVSHRLEFFGICPDCDEP